MKPEEIEEIALKNLDRYIIEGEGDDESEYFNLSKSEMISVIYAIIAEIQRRQKPFRLPFPWLMYDENQTELVCVTPDKWSEITLFVHSCIYPTELETPKE